MKTFASMFTGGGGADVGASLAGLEHLWGIEWSADICGVAWLNGYPTINADVRDVDYRDLTRPDWLHASPPCINASVANKNAGESDLDMELAQAVCRAIVALKPDYFSLENVRGYTTFKAYQAIKECLLANGYKYIDGILNAADYGTPQTRIRLFLVASRVAAPKLPLPTHYDARSGAMNMLLTPWIGWHEAIKDLLDDLPDAHFAPWQLKRLPAELRTSLVDTTNSARDATIREPNEPSYTIKASHMRRPSTQPMAVLVGGGNTNSQATHSPMRDCDTPAYTVTGSSDRDRAYLINSTNEGQQYSDGLRRESQPSMTLSTQSKPKAFVIDGQTGSYGTAMTIREQAEPMYTIAASHEKRPARAYIGRVVKLTPRCLARFNGLPDSYQLPIQQSLACKVLGNMVMPEVMAVIIRSTSQQ